MPSHIVLAPHHVHRRHFHSSSARKDRFVYGGAIFVDVSQPAPGSRSGERTYNLLFTNLDMNVTRYLHHDVDRRVPNATYAQPRWIPASLLLDANMYVPNSTDKSLSCHMVTCSDLASQEDEIPVWDSEGRIHGAANRSPLLHSMIGPQNDGIGHHSLLIECV
jgi:hypothetical protein